MATEGVHVDFTEGAVDEMAAIAHQANRSGQNIGARRLYTITEKLMEDISFDAPERRGQSVTIDAEYVRGHLADITKNEELGRFGFHSLKQQES